MDAGFKGGAMAGGVCHPWVFGNKDPVMSARPPPQRGYICALAHLFRRKQSQKFLVMKFELLRAKMSWNFGGKFSATFAGKKA